MLNLKDISESVSFGNIELLARLVVEGFITGLHKSPFHGFSVEFAEHRQYNSGESIKNIDWKLFGRTDKLFVKRFEEETNLRSRIVIDTSSSMLFPFREKINNKLAFSVFSAAAIINLLNRQRDAAGLTFYSDKIELHTDVKMSTFHSKFLFNQLSELLKMTSELQRKTKSSEILHQIADKIHRRSLVLLFSDMFHDDDSENIFSALQHFRYNKHEVVLFHVVDRLHEDAFRYVNRPHKFVDMETGEILKINPSEVKVFFEKKTQTYYDKLKLKCAQFGIDYVSADINSNFGEVLIAYLLKRQKLF